MMSTTGDNSTMSCANCGKEGSNLNSCNRCKLVKYCNAACKKKHRSKHKKKCDRRVAEMHDEALFKQPALEDCSICFLRMPSLGTGWKYHSCCGKIICSGCVYAGSKMDGNVDDLCPFCRIPAPTSDEEILIRIKKRVDVGDAQAMYNLAGYYLNGLGGLPQDWEKVLELWHRAGELGHETSYHNIGYAYWCGDGVERDETKATHYFELAAIGGNAEARHNLGNGAIRAGNYGGALKHYMIAVGSGSNTSLKTIQQMYKGGNATRVDYTNALKAYQVYLSEVKSDDRDNAASFGDHYKYY